MAQIEATQNSHPTVSEVGTDGIDRRSNDQIHCRSLSYGDLSFVRISEANSTAEVADCIQDK